MLAKPGVTGDFRKTLEETLVALEARPAEQPKADENQTVLNVAADGSISLNGKVVSLEELGAKLKALTQQDTDHSVLICGEAKVHYKIINDVLSVCREANVQKVAIKPLPDKSEKPAPASKAAEVERAEQLVQRNRQLARLRAADDRQIYKPEELAEIESLYQVANRNWRTDEARVSLKKLLEKYDRANRTGCATLYMGQMSTGQERLDYLTRAVEKFSDCYYFNGCQVGGYGRYVLALTLWETGEKEKARVLLEELQTTYKDATDHQGRPMGEVADTVEKELAGK